MFDDLLESTNQKKKTNKGWSVILSGLVQTVILGILVLIPLIYTEAVPPRPVRPRSQNPRLQWWANPQYRPIDPPHSARDLLARPW